jgi:amino acid transporter
MKKDIGPVTAVSIALGSIIGWGAFVMPGNFLLANSGPLGIVIGFILGGALMILIAYSYRYMIMVYPKSGGEFTYSYNSFGRVHAFIVGWFLSLAYISIVPLNVTAITLISRFVFPDVFNFGYLYTIYSWDIYIGELILSIGTLLIVGYSSSKKILYSKYIQLLTVGVLVGSLVMIIISISFSGIDISNLSPVFPSNRSAFDSIVAVLAIAPWAFLGFDNIPQIIEDVSFNKQKTFLIMAIAILIGAIIYIALALITAIAFQWEPFISSSPNWATGIAVELFLGRSGVVLITFGMMGAVISGINGFLLSSSKLLSALSDYKLIPEWFSKKSNDKSMPKHAVWFVVVLAAFAPFFGREVLIWIVDMASIGAGIAFFYTSLSAFRHARINKASNLNQLLFLVSSLTSIIFIGLLLVPFSPVFLSNESIFLLIIWIILGIVFSLSVGKNFISTT